MKTLKECGPGCKVGKKEATKEHLITILHEKEISLKAITSQSREGACAVWQEEKQKHLWDNADLTALSKHAEGRCKTLNSDCQSFLLRCNDASGSEADTCLHPYPTVSES